MTDLLARALAALKDCAEVVEDDIASLIDSGCALDSDGKPVFETLDDLHAEAIAEMSPIAERARAILKEAAAIRAMEPGDG